MSNGVGSLPALRLRQEIDRTRADGTFGGAFVLQQLSEVALSCVIGTDDAKDSVVFALAALLKMHSSAMDERPVPLSEANAAEAAMATPISDAIAFIESGGSADEAVRIIATLANARPDAVRRGFASP